MSSIVSIDTRGYDISMGPGVLRVGGGGGLAGNVYINGNVGIGTSSPNSRLDVNGKISSNAEISVGGTPNAGNSGGYRLLRLTPVSGTATQITFDTSISTGTGQNYIYSDNTIMEIKSPLTNFTGGSVGIGTSTPSRLLDVRGDAQIGVSTNKCIEIISGTTDLTYINFHSKDVSYNNYDTRITSTGGSTSGQTQRGNLLYSALNHAFNTGGTDKMTITSNGSVGIGTTTPTATLDVNGTLSVGTGIISTKAYLFVGSALRSRNSSGVLTTPTVNAYSYMSAETQNNTNWTASYSGGNTSRLLVPVAGVYSVTFCMTPTAGNQNLELFISKNECNAFDLNTVGLLSTSATVGLASCISTTVFMTTTDYISCGFFFGSGTAFVNDTMSTRARMTLTLLQRTA